MRVQSPRTPPPSSYSHAPHHTPHISVHEITHRIGLSPPEEICHSRSPSFISRLPPEILAEIFVYCVPEGRFPLPYRTEAPLLLAHVSSQWRALSMSMPELWTGLHVDYKDPTVDIPATNRWLALSGNKPLSLSIAIDFSEQPQQGILDAICRHSKRWKHIRFEFRNLFCAPMYSLDMALNNIEELETFDFYARDISTINVAPIISLLSSAPKIKEITWVDDLADTDTLLQLPLGRLTHLSLSMDHGTLDRRVLDACYNLEHIKFTRPFSLTPHLQEPLLLPKLNSITLSSTIAGALDHLVLPALHQVRIHGENDRRQMLGHDISPAAHTYHPSPFTETWDPTPLISLVKRSACSITRLSTSAPMTETALLECLHGIGASLVSLVVEGTSVGDTLLQALTFRWSERGALCTAPPDALTDMLEARGGHGTTKDRQPVCPCLEELVLDTRVGCTLGMLAGMVESRVLIPGQAGDATNGGECEHACYESHRNRVAALRTITVVDGHKDLPRLKTLSALSRKHADITRKQEGPFSVNAIPRKPSKTHTRDYVFRRKLCASR